MLRNTYDSRLYPPTRPENDGLHPLYSVGATRLQSKLIHRNGNR